MYRRHDCTTSSRRLSLVTRTLKLGGLASALSLACCWLLPLGGYAADEQNISQCVEAISTWCEGSGSVDELRESLHDCLVGKNATDEGATACYEQNGDGQCGGCTLRWWLTSF